MIGLLLGIIAITPVLAFVLWRFIFLSISNHVRKIVNEFGRG